MDIIVTSQWAKKASSTLYAATADHARSPTRKYDSRQNMLKLVLRQVPAAYLQCTVVITWPMRRSLRPGEGDCTQHKPDDQDAQQPRLVSCFPRRNAEIHDIGVVSFISCRQWFSAPAGR
jgi:hypothetical protein